MIIKDKYENMTIEEAENYLSKGWGGVCDADGLIVTLQEEKFIQQKERV